jgi:hypothetical protein
LLRARARIQAALARYQVPIILPAGSGQTTSPHRSLRCPPCGRPA